MTRVTRDQIDIAYRKLKSFAYYDKTDLRLRARLARFECDAKFQSNLRTVHKVVNKARPAADPRFLEWLNQIRFRLVPKKLAQAQQNHSDEDSKGRFITNVTTSPKIAVERVNYFFDGPIELHIIAVLWIMLEGKALDSMLGAECCGSRLSNSLHDDNDNSLSLFAKYHEQYARWRDSGIRRARQLLVKEQRNVAILGLDIQEYFYRINIDFNEVRNALEIDAGRPHPLLKCIEAIGIAYRECITPFLNDTHDISGEVTGLPIGLCSSLVLANWYLIKLDSAILETVRPAYYGRYVDDILLVVPLRNDPTVGQTHPVTNLIETLLVRTGILKGRDKNTHEICARSGLLLQQSKCILQYFDTRHSIAGLEKFQKKLEENGSDFLLLPVDEADNSLEDVAYELLYEGSVNRFRSVKGIAENRYALAKHLAKQTIFHLLTDDPPNRKISRGLQTFFKGRSAIEFCDLWERVFTLLSVAGDQQTRKAFVKQLRSEIELVNIDRSTEISEQLRNDLKEHLRLSLAMAMATSSRKPLKKRSDPQMLREANLLRHHFILRPLLNFTSYVGPLGASVPKESVELNPKKVDYSPRFVNLDECMMLANSGDIKLSTENSFFEYASDLFNKINRQSVTGISWSAADAIKK